MFNSIDDYVNKLLPPFRTILSSQLMKSELLSDMPQLVTGTIMKSTDYKNDRRNIVHPTGQAWWLYSNQSNSIINLNGKAFYTRNGNTVKIYLQYLKQHYQRLDIPHFNGIEHIHVYGHGTQSIYFTRPSSLLKSINCYNIATAYCANNNLLKMNYTNNVNLTSVPCRVMRIENDASVTYHTRSVTGKMGYSMFYPILNSVPSYDSIVVTANNITVGHYY
jgi:hypothetical protein